MSDFRESLRVEIGDMEDIPLEPNTPKDIKKYEEHKEQRNKRVYEKMGYEYKRGKAHIDEEWQKEIIQDVRDEMR